MEDGLCREDTQDLVLSLLEVELRRLKKDQSQWRQRGRKSEETGRSSRKPEELRDTIPKSECY